MKDPNDFMLKPAHTEVEYEALAAELANAKEEIALTERLADLQANRFEARIATLEQHLADMTADYHRWHDAYMELKYPGGGQRVAVTPDQARIAHLEAALREVLAYVTQDSEYPSAWVNRWEAALSGEK
jgi:hypothetical protein